MSLRSLGHSSTGFDSGVGQTVAKPGMFKRAFGIGKGKADKSISKVEDPRQLLKSARDELLRTQNELKQAVVDISRARKTIEMHGRRMESQRDEYNQKAVEALQVGRDDLAEQAVKLRITVEANIERFAGNYQKALAKEQAVRNRYVEVEQSIQEFNTTAELMTSQYEAARAMDSINATMTGLNGKMTDAARAVDYMRAETARLEARADVVHELTNAGELRNALAPDPVSSRLVEARLGEMNVKQELEKLRSSATTGVQAKQVQKIGMEQTRQADAASARVYNA